MHVGTEGHGEESDLHRIWTAAVFRRFNDQCSACGGRNRLVPKLVVPEKKGGRLTVENSALLCFSCDNASGLGGMGEIENDRMVDINVSRRICDLVHSWPERKLFTTMSAGLRRLIGMFLEFPERFSDLPRYQDNDPVDPKINFWMNRAIYLEFQNQVKEMGLSVKDALVGLILLYEESLEESHD